MMLALSASFPTPCSPRFRSTHHCGLRPALNPRSLSKRCRAGSFSAEERLSQVANLISLEDKLDLAFNTPEGGKASEIWDLVSEIPERDRAKLLDRLGPKEIINLWKISAARHTSSEMKTGRASFHSLWDDFPEEPGQVYRYDGIAALPAFNFLGLNRFQKAYFLEPESDDLYGRVLLNRGPPGDSLYPGYFKANIDISTVNPTGELADMTLEYLPREKLGLRDEDVPVAGWPKPKDPLYPFSGGLVDYLRPIGPGVYAGVGWKAPRPEKNDMGRRFLFFVMARVVD
ncbi:hypothetical protein BSKO_12988 [Bryopsis sp. KO-2023]|nr:hypothetical protein BSKO_12988 [Bryopsis sp. KO-2023]